jgi:hypothetical protein
MASPPQMTPTTNTPRDYSKSAPKRSIVDLTLESLETQEPEEYHLSLHTPPQKAKTTPKKNTPFTTESSHSLQTISSLEGFFFIASPAQCKPYKTERHTNYPCATNSYYATPNLFQLKCSPLTEPKQSIKKSQFHIPHGSYPTTTAPKLFTPTNHI